MRAEVDAINAFKPCASFGFLMRGLLRNWGRVGSGKSMLRLETEVAARGLTGTLEGTDNDDEAGDCFAPSGLAMTFGFTAPDSFSSRTIASTIAASLASSISKISSSNDFSRYHLATKV